MCGSLQRNNERRKRHLLICVGFLPAVYGCHRVLSPIRSSGHRTSASPFAFSRKQISIPSGASAEAKLKTDGNLNVNKNSSFKCIVFDEIDYNLIVVRK